MKNYTKKYWSITVVLLSVWMLGFQENQGLQNIGSFSLWIMGLLSLLAVSNLPIEKMPEGKSIMEFLWIVAVLLMAYKGLFVFATIYLVVRVVRFARLKELTVK